jgi:tRNA1Val (adenine37-N6)-methyltransferase
MAFRFKQFEVEDNCSSMRVGTDAVLLGSWTDPGKAGSILEIGTGCGVIALMLAQRSGARIDAIDIDESSVQQAEANFRKSPWSAGLNAIPASLQDFTRSSGKKFDLILTNPPFFAGDLRSPDPLRNLARHDAGLTHGELLDCVRLLLKGDGWFNVILPAGEFRKFTNAAGESGLFLHRQMNIRPKHGKPVNRVLAGYGFRAPEKPEREDLVIRKEDGTYTEHYVSFTEAYYFSLR